MDLPIKRNTMQYISHRYIYIHVIMTHNIFNTPFTTFMLHYSTMPLTLPYTRYTQYVLASITAKQ